jgi:hypothetical protein
MCSVYPERRDAYEDDIIKIHSFFGEKFYSYHKQFSAKAAVIFTGASSSRMACISTFITGM